MNYFIEPSNTSSQVRSCNQKILNLFWNNKSKHLPIIWPSIDFIVSEIFTMKTKQVLTRIISSSSSSSSSSPSSPPPGEAVCGFRNTTQPGPQEVSEEGLWLHTDGGRYVCSRTHRRVDIIIKIHPHGLLLVTVRRVWNGQVHSGEQPLPHRPLQRQEATERWGWVFPLLFISPYQSQWNGRLTVN